VTPAQLATLAELVEAFVPAADEERIATLAADALERAADPAQVAQLALVLRVLESRLVNGLTARRWTSFRDLSPDDRQSVLLDWAGSAIPQRRSAFGAFRKLLTFLAYADPGTPEEPNRLLHAIGYEPDRPPITDAPSSIEVLELERSPSAGDRPIVLEADVVVVGSGAGGGVVAAELARAGRSVVVLEAGPFVDERAMPRNELDAYSRLYLNHGLLSTWDGAITLLAGSGVGGGTLVNWMTCIDVPADVRAEWASEHGLDGIGPGDDAEWVADVTAIQAELGVSPARVVPPKDELIQRGAAALGWQAERIHRNATDCGVCGSCPFGCVVGAKASGIRAHLRTASEAGARIVDRVRVTRLLVEEGGGTVAGVEGRLLMTDPFTDLAVTLADDPTSTSVRRLLVRAPQVVLAAGALRSPAILQASGGHHSAVGRHLRVHPVSVVAARATEPVDMWRGTMQAVASQEFVAGDATRRGYVIESAPGHPGLLALALPWAGAIDHAGRMAKARHIAPLVAVTRDGGEGRTSLTKAGRVRIDYRLDALGVATLRHGLVSMARIARAAGGVEEILGVGMPPLIHHLAPGTDGTGHDAGFEAYLALLGSMHFAPNRGAVFSAHQMGTVRMGADPADHPADARGRVRHDEHGRVVAGLYVADGSTFPTGVGVNPMVGIMAMGRRVSRAILAEGRAAG